MTPMTGWRADRAIPISDSDDRPGVLVRSPTPPSVASDLCVDVRPGAAATFDGDHVRFPLSVVDDESVARLDWSDLSGLEAVVEARLRGEHSATIRFGDRSMCQTAIGADGVAAVERRLASVARRAQARLVTWTRATPSDAAARTYEVVDRPRGRPD